MANTTSGPSCNVRESSTLSTTSVQPHNYSIKLGAPPKFTGTLDSLANLIFYCNIEFTVKPLTYEDDAKKVIFLISHLGSLTSGNGAAFTWARTMHKKKDECIEDFDLSVERLEEFYGSAEEYSAAEAEIKLEKLRQTKSCAEYAATFDQLTATLGFNDKAKTTLFKRGLKTQIQTALAGLNETLDNYKELCEAAVCIDQQMFQLPLDSRPSSLSNTTSLTTNFSKSKKKDKKRNFNSNSSGSKRRGPLSLEEKAHCKKNNLCIYCRKSGHIVSHCPIKPWKPTAVTQY